MTETVQTKTCRSCRYYLAYCRAMGNCEALPGHPRVYPEDGELGPVTGRPTPRKCDRFGKLWEGRR